MKWNFLCRHSVCIKCGAHFEPVTGYEARWGDLCNTHRQPVREQDEKRDAVIAWASQNWRSLAEQMEKERNATSNQFAAYANASAQASAQMSQSQPNSIFGYYGRGF